MLHRIPTAELRSELGAWADTMAGAVSSCVHCGFCLPTCPTYVELGEETDSPRGRIVLMKGALEGELGADDVAPHLDACLGCVACVASCPSGVRYGELVTPFRSWLERRRARPAIVRLWRWFLLHVLPYRQRFRALLVLARPVRALLRLVPDRLVPVRLRAALDLLPARRREPPPSSALDPIATARGPVAVLASCAQQALAPHLDRVSERVLDAFGFDVVVPPKQGCCGALALHSGELELARAHACSTLAAFDRTAGPVVTSAAGCGSAVRELGLLFRGTPDERRALGIATRARDVCTVLAGVFDSDRSQTVELPALERPLRVVYHDPCHLQHAQGERDAPRRLLQAIPNLHLVEPAESEICCGSAGTYNLEQPTLAARLGARKAHHLLRTEAEVVATANIGCAVQLRAHLDRLGHPLPVVHVVELLEQALRRRV